MIIIIEKNINGRYRQEKYQNVWKIYPLSLMPGLRIVFDDGVIIDKEIDMVEGDCWEIIDDRY